MPIAKSSAKIVVERPTEAKRKRLGVASWPIWAKEPSTFDWHYDEPETCYFLEGEATVTSDAGEVRIGPGDLVTFPQGLQCTWRVTRAVRKHYKFG